MTPEFPVFHCVRFRTGWPWNRRTTTKCEEYEDLEMLANDLEWIDTRKHSDMWIEDAKGTLWDVKLNIHFDTLDNTEYYAITSENPKFGNTRGDCEK